MFNWFIICVAINIYHNSFVASGSVRAYFQEVQLPVSFSTCCLNVPPGMKKAITEFQCQSQDLQISTMRMLLPCNVCLQILGMEIIFKLAMFKEMLIESNIAIQRKQFDWLHFDPFFLLLEYYNCFYLTVNYYFEFFFLGIVTRLQYTASSEQAKVYKLPCQYHVFVAVFKILFHSGRCNRLENHALNYLILWCQQGKFYVIQA